MSTQLKGQLTPNYNLLRLHHTILVVHVVYASLKAESSFILKKMTKQLTQNFVMTLGKPKANVQRSLCPLYRVVTIAMHTKKVR